MKIEDRRWLKPREFSELFSISPKHLYTLMAQGLVPAARKKGIGWRLDRVKFEAELQAGIEMRSAR